MDPEEQDQSLPSRKEIAQLFSMLACNAHTICDDEEHPIGRHLVLVWQFWTLECRHVITIARACVRFGQSHAIA